MSYKKQMSFSKKLIFIIIGKGVKFVVECVSNNGISLKCLFHLNLKFFFAKTSFLNLEKLEDI